MRRFAFLIPVLILVFGCGGGKAPSGMLDGTITYKGSPVNGCALVLHNVNVPGPGDTVNIPVSQEGTFQVSDVPEGEYKIVVQPSAGFSGNVPKGKELSAEDRARLDSMRTPATIPIPDKYTKRDTTELRVTVVKGENKLKLELKD